MAKQTALAELSAEPMVTPAGIDALLAGIESAGDETVQAINRRIAEVASMIEALEAKRRVWIMLRKSLQWRLHGPPKCRSAQSEPDSTEDQQFEPDPALTAPKREKIADVIRREIAECIWNHDDCSVNQISREITQPWGRVRSLLSHPWFHQTNKGLWALTAEGLRESRCQAND